MESFLHGVFSKSTLGVGGVQDVEGIQGIAREGLSPGYHYRDGRKMEGLINFEEEARQSAYEPKSQQRRRSRSGPAAARKRPVGGEDIECREETAEGRNFEKAKG